MQNVNETPLTAPRRLLFVCLPPPHPCKLFRLEPFLIGIILTAAKSARLCSQHPRGNRHVQEVEDAESAWPLAICLVKYGLNCGCAPPPSLSFFQQLSLHASMKRCSISRKCSCQYFLPFPVVSPTCLMNKSDFIFLVHLTLEANIIVFGS